LGGLTNLGQLLSALRHFFPAPHQFRNLFSGTQKIILETFFQKTNVLTFPLMKNTIGKVFDGVGKEIDGCSCSNLHPLDKKSK